MKGIAQILFGCAMLLLSIASGVMIPVTGGGVVFYVIALAAPIPGVLFAIGGLINASQNLEEKDKRDEEKQESTKKGEDESKK